MVAPRTHELFQPGNSWGQFPDLSGVTRVNVVDSLGSEEYRDVVVDLLLQDDGRTLKVLIFE